MYILYDPRGRTGRARDIDIPTSRPTVLAKLGIPVPPT